MIQYQLQRTSENVFAHQSWLTQQTSTCNLEMCLIQLSSSMNCRQARVKINIICQAGISGWGDCPGSRRCSILPNPCKVFVPYFARTPSQMLPSQPESYRLPLEDFVFVPVSNWPIWDVTPESIPFYNANLLCNVACRLPWLELKSHFHEIHRKLIICVEDLLCGTNDVVVIDASKFFQVVIQHLEQFVEHNSKELAALNHSLVNTLVNLEWRIDQGHATPHVNVWLVANELMAEHQNIS